MKPGSAITTAALLIALAACGDNIRPPNNGDANPGVDAAVVDAAPDAPPAATFTSFVIDLVQNQTSNTTAPKPFSDFATLPDPDGDSNNTAAYNPLFP